MPNRPSWARRHRGLLAAAAVTVAVLAAGAVVVTEDTGDRVATDPSPVGPTPTPTPTEDSAPDPTPPAGEAPLATEPRGPAGPFVAYEGVLGTWDGARWVQWTPGAPTSGGDFTLVHLDEPLATVAGTSASVPCSPEATPGIDLGLELPAAARATTPIGVAGVADPRPAPSRSSIPATARTPRPSTRRSPAGASRARHPRCGRSCGATSTATASPRS